METNRFLFKIGALAASAAVVALLAACGGGGQSAAAAGEHGRFAPSQFSPRVTNPWFPLTPGTTLVYRGSEDGEPIRDVVEVTRQAKAIGGARCAVVRDRLYRKGVLAERTTDWYSQDPDGNVWYFGEDTAELNPKGHVVSTEGTWRSGVRGARAGVFMPAHPKVGQRFRQEYFKGHAEDHFQVLSLRARVAVPFTRTGRALLTKEWTPLEPGVIDHKWYVRGIGSVREQTVRGGSEKLLLVSVQHR